MTFPIILWPYTLANRKTITALQLANYNENKKNL